MPVPNHSVFTGWMPFLPPNRQRQSTEGKLYCLIILIIPSNRFRYKRPWAHLTRVIPSGRCNYLPDTSSYFLWSDTHLVSNWHGCRCVSNCMKLLGLLNSLGYLHHYLIPARRVCYYGNWCYMSCYEVECMYRCVGIDRYVSDIFV